MKIKTLLSIAPLIASVFMTPPGYAQNATGPINMGPVINTAARDAEPTFTPDGQTMYFNCFDRQGTVGSDICVTHRQGTTWTEPEIVHAVSTSQYLEVEPLLSPDGQELSMWDLLCIA